MDFGKKDLRTGMVAVTVGGLFMTVIRGAEGGAEDRFEKNKGNDRCIYFNDYSEDLKDNCGWNTQFDIIKVIEPLTREEYQAALNFEYSKVEGRTVFERVTSVNLKVAQRMLKEFTGGTISINVEVEEFKCEDVEKLLGWLQKNAPYTLKKYIPKEKGGK